MFDINDRVKFIGDSIFIKTGSVGTVTSSSATSCYVSFDSGVDKKVVGSTIYCGYFELQKFVADDQDILKEFWRDINKQRESIIDTYGYKDLRYDILSNTLNDIELAIKALRRN